jgi:hypothetical protein
VKLKRPEDKTQRRYQTSRFLTPIFFRRSLFSSLQKKSFPSEDRPQRLNSSLKNSVPHQGIALAMP